MFKISQKQKAIREYYKKLTKCDRGVHDKGTVKMAFQHLLEAIAKQPQWILTPKNTLKRGKKRIRLDGVLFDDSNLVRGYWESESNGSQDDLDLPTDIQKKLYKDNYPQDNILFQAAERAILYQNGHEVLDLSLSEPANLVNVLDNFFNFKRPEYERWEIAADEFKNRVPEVGKKLLVLIQQARVDNQDFEAAFNRFADQCRQTINPNLADAAIEEMLIQHLLTERLFRRIFNQPDFAKHNIIAREIENVIEKLTAQSFNRDAREAFFDELKDFYKALEDVAATVEEYAHKQHFLNTVCERFFRGFAVKVAETHGIVYTPQPIVDFMVKSVSEILQNEFGKSLASQGVHILDPFVGTGHFIARVMREIAAISQKELNYKYAHELHCNEVMLLPYYIASMNIEHECLDLIDNYQAFEGICLADTFELAEDKRVQLIADENTDRLEKQTEFINSAFFVIIGNPPCNVGQANENDNNKNRQYKVIDGRIRETYAQDSKANLVRKLWVPYVKAIRWASDRIGEEGIVAFVNNNSFLDDLSFDGMRKHLEQDFSKIFILDLKGNVRKDSMRDGIPIGEKHTVFGLAAMVGISITFFVKSKKIEKNCKIFYSAVDWNATREEKFGLIEKAETYSRLDYQPIQPDKKHTWLTEGLHPEFEAFLPLGTKEAKKAKTAIIVKTAKTAKNAQNAKKAVEGVIFKTYGLGVATNRDAWAYNFNPQVLADNMQRCIETYNEQVEKWSRRKNQSADVNDFVLSDDKKLSWSRDLKLKVKRGQSVDFEAEKIRLALYRPFTKSNLFFDFVLVDVPGQFSKIFPTTENENRVICLAGIGNRKGFGCLVTNLIPSLDLAFEKAQSFPLYIYNKDGTNRTENITDWALTHFRDHYKDDTITKLAIFHYVYGLLHHPGYCEKYAANLKRELPRLPLSPNFWAFSKAGETLADLHLNYEQQAAYPLKEIENPKVPYNMRVDKMRLSKDKTQLIYNDFITLEGIPKEVFKYRLGNRSAIKWMIDQYRVKVDKRSGIINDPNREDDERYIVELMKKVITVSLETVRVVEGLPRYI